MGGIEENRFTSLLKYSHSTREFITFFQFQSTWNWMTFHGTSNIIAWYNNVPQHVVAKHCITVCYAWLCYIALHRLSLHSRASKGIALLHKNVFHKHKCSAADQRKSRLISTDHRCLSSPQCLSPNQPWLSSQTWQKSLKEIISTLSAALKALRQSPLSGTARTMKIRYTPPPLTATTQTTRSRSCPVSTAADTAVRLSTPPITSSPVVLWTSRVSKQQLFRGRHCFSSVSYLSYQLGSKIFQITRSFTHASL